MAVKPTTLEQLAEASAALNTLLLAVETLKQAAAHITNKNVLKHLKFATDGLQNELFVHKKVIESAGAQICALDVALIGVAQNRAFELTDLIRLNKGAVRRLQRAYELGASDNPVTDNDIAMVEEERAALEAELATINIFLQDGDKSRLAGTSLALLVDHHDG